MSNVTVELTYDGFDEVRCSSEMEEILREEVDRIASNCGDGYVGDVKALSSRSVGIVYTDTNEAKKDNLANNTLLKVSGL